MSRYPPVPGAARPLVGLVRLLGGVVLVLGLVLAALLLSRREPGQAALAAVLSAAVATATWLPPMSRAFRVAVALILLAVTAATRSWWVFAATVALLAVLAGAGRLLLSRLGPSDVHVLPPGTVMAGASQSIDELESRSFNPVGAVGFEVARFRVVMSVLLSADRLRYAIVTDSVIQVVSQIDDIRFLVSRNSAFGALGAGELGNDMRGADIAELDDGHLRALNVIEPLGAAPVPQLGEMVVQRVFEATAHDAASWAPQAPKPWDSGAGSGPIDGSPASLERARSWLGLPPAG